MTFGFNQGSLPFKYLGSMLYKGRRKRIYYQHVIDKVAGKLGWKGNLLSSGGQLILTKHVLETMPVFLFVPLPPQKLVLQQLEQMFFKFTCSEQH